MVVRWTISVCADSGSYSEMRWRLRKVEPRSIPIASMRASAAPNSPLWNVYTVSLVGEVDLDGALER